MCACVRVCVCVCVCVCAQALIDRIHEDARVTKQVLEQDAALSAHKQDVRLAPGPSATKLAERAASTAAPQ